MTATLERPAVQSGSRDLPVDAIHALDVADALSRLETDPRGLTKAEAARRRALHGPNEIPRGKSDGPLVLIWRQINNPLIWVLLGASLVATLLGKVTDGAVVLAVVVLNTLVGFIQEYRAGRAIEALAGMVPEFATVLRDGIKRSLPVRELVPGDVVLLASGDKVPADLRLIEVRNLQIDESALTGESVPVSKQPDAVAGDAPLGDRTGMAFGGTLVTYGTGTGVISAIGMKTELGRISAMLREATHVETPLTRALAVIGRYITAAILLLSLVLLAVGMYRALSNGIAPIEAFRESLLFAIALAVGAIPEGLPAIVTIALAIGVQRMALRRAIVRKLPAVETLGSTTVICSDKTGTLTRNEMTVQELWTPATGAVAVTGIGYEPHGEIRKDGVPISPLPEGVLRLLRACVLCSDATISETQGGVAIAGDPTEAALVVAARKAGIRHDEARAEAPRLDAIPFESENQFMATVHPADDGQKLVILKGAPEVILARCTSALDRQSVLAEVEALARRGMRVLAAASRTMRMDSGELVVEDCVSGFTLEGLAGMIDPPRAEAIEAVRACRSAGITVKMITGDHRATAEAVGRELGITSESPALTGVDLARCDDDTLRRVARETNVFARVAPEHKLRLVRALQAEGHVVAMTGDGVNDAPALKQADIGVAMGITGTSVSKEAADVVLTDDNFASIAAAVDEGRRVYDNLIKSLAFVLPTNLGLALILLYAVAFFPFSGESGLMLLPIAPTQLLWINLVATVALALPLAFENREPDSMRRPPRPANAPVLSRFVLVRTAVAALLMTAGAVCLFVWEYFHAVELHLSDAVALAEAQTMAVTTVIMFQVFYLLNCRSLRGSLLSVGVFSNPAVFLGIAGVLLLQAAFIYMPIMNGVFGTAPLAPGEIALCVAVGATILPVISLEKWLRRRAVRNDAKEKLRTRTS
ncbi:MAG: HAD-IC family P-type ATPase [Candidatus Hydrogenedentes bacterium]|nr:HAD-IC family P-type ATPase [Candidatus Hydrogenedentota bacterium]